MPIYNYDGTARIDQHGRIFIDDKQVGKVGITTGHTDDTDSEQEDE